MGLIGFKGAKGFSCGGSGIGDQSMQAVVTC